MITIKYKDENGFYQDLDVDQNEIVRVSKSVLDYKDPSKRKSDFSKSFRLPFSDVNNQFFNIFYDPTFQGATYSPYVEQEVELFEGLDLIMRGNLKLEAIDRERPFYQVRIFGRLNTIKNALGEKLLGELDWSEYNHEFSYANVSGSWTGTVTLQAGGTTDKLLYPLADWGKGYGLNGFDITSSSTPVSINDFYVAINYRQLIEDMFTKNGLNLDLTEFVTDYPWFDKIFYQLTPDNEKAIQTQDLSFLAGISQTITHYLEDGDSVLYTKIPFQAVSNNSGAFNDATNEFICPGGGSYDLEYVVRGSYVTDDAADVTVRAAIFKNGVKINASEDTFNVLTAGPGVSDGTFTLNLNTGANASVFGDTFDVRYEIDVAAQPDVIATVNIDTAGTEYYLLSAPSLLIGGTVQIGNVMGDVKQVDLLKSFLNQFNLVAIQDEDIETNVTVKTWDRWISEGTVRDWTDRVDVSKPVIVKPATDYMRQAINYQYKESDDFLNERYVENTGFVYGTAHIDTGIAYTSQQQELFTIFSAYPTAYIDLTDEMYVAKYFKDPANPSLEKVGPQIFFYNGLKTNNPIFYIDRISGIVGRTSYPRCSNFNLNVGFNVVAETVDLNFAFNYPFDGAGYVQTETENTIYNLFHKNYNFRLYDLANRYVECFVLIDPAEYEDVKMNDTILIDFGSGPGYYRLIDIVEYPVNMEDTVKIKLLKA